MILKLSQNHPLMDQSWDDHGLLIGEVFCWYDLTDLIWSCFSSPSDNFIHKIFIKIRGEKSIQRKIGSNLEKHIFEGRHTTEKDCYQNSMNWNTVHVKSRSILHLRANSESSKPSDIPYLFMFQLLSSYLLCPILFTPAYSFCPTLSYYHAIYNHVVLFPSCPHIMCWLNLMFVRSLLPPNSSTRSRSASLSPNTSCI